MEPLWLAARTTLRDRATATLPARRWASLARTMHMRMDRAGYPVHRQLLDVSPLTKLWAAWRVR